LFVVSLLPFVGGLATAIVAVLGFGAVVLTRFGKLAPGATPGAASVGPYR
jgi:hypothetical protein